MVPELIYNPVRNTYYRLEGVIADGGEGQVWAGVFLPSLPVAIKIIHPTANAAQAFNSWHRDQAIHLKCLQHPNIVQTFDQFYSPTHGWVIVMEKATCSLDQLMQTGTRLDQGQVCAIGSQILTALEHLHSCHVMHRDLKPKNILLFPGGVTKVSDFGVAKTGVLGNDITRTMLGTRDFLPPELHAHGHWSYQSDIYQVGLILLSLLMGRNVIPSGDPDTVRNMILGGVPRQSAESLFSTYPNLARVIYYMVCRTESIRYRSALSARADLWLVSMGQTPSRFAGAPKVASRTAARTLRRSTVMQSLPSNR